MTLTYQRDARGGRVFAYAGRRFRAFWLTLGHEWSIRELDADGGFTGRRWAQKNWPAVEAFMEWLARTDGRAQ